ncbi:MAG TPA: Mur ligase family protein, partial [Saprospiraceae bacterium]|nr:Mur ligase family protein [Saprospiraceae bacterium]
MPALSHLLAQVATLETHGDLGIEVGSLRFDSRAVQPGDVFVAVRGATVDGHKFIERAIENGAAAIVCEHVPDAPIAPHPACIVVPDSAEALGRMASNFYHDPSASLCLVGVTGTNGKTTTVTLLWQLFTALGYRCGLIGTVENRVGDTVLASTHTTPDALSLHGLLRQMADAGCTYVFMEVSSHAVHQRRTAGLSFAGGVFSNLTHDHLDYHHTFADYRDAKKRFFDDLPATAFAQERR